MDAKATVKALMDAVQTADFKKAKSLLADDFQFSGPIHEPVNGEQWLGMLTSLKTAFPKLDYHFGIEGADANVVHITAQLSGTHSGSLDLTAMGMGVTPATGKSFSAAREPGNVTVQGDKVASWAVQPTEGAGLMAILSQLGISVPAK